MQWSRLFPLHKHICLKKSFQFFSNIISVFIHIHIHIYEATVLIWSFLQKLGLCMLYYRFISHLTKSALFFEINNILLKICIISSNQTCSLTYIQLLFNFSLKCHWLLPLHRNTHDSHGSTLSTSHTAGSRVLSKLFFTFPASGHGRRETVRGEILRLPKFTHISTNFRRKGFNSERSIWASLQEWSPHRFLLTFFGNFCPIKFFLCFFNFVWRK